MDSIVAEFISETQEALDAVDSALLALERDPAAVEPVRAVFRLMHTIKGTSGFLGFVRLGRLTHQAEDVLGRIRDGDLRADAATVAAVFRAVDRTKELIAHIGAHGAEPAGDDADVAALLAGGSEPTPTATLPPLDPSTADAVADIAIDELVRSGLVALDDAIPMQFALAAQLGAGERCDPAWAAAIAIGCAALGVATPPPAIAPAPVGSPEPVPPPAEPPAAPAPAPTPKDETIRVALPVLERMMTYVSELVLLRNQLLQLSRREGETPFAPTIGRLDQVTSDLQEAVMAARMQPIGAAWAKLPRIVRDLARDVGKEVELAMSGEDTELDRQVIECIRDPLTHMIRNAVDHGIERPDERRAAGKPACGRVSLSARHEGGAVAIVIADDGRGLSVERIGRKALEKNIVTPAELQAMGEQQVLQLIFRPGFSTAEQVTSISGRGVGMDVVRANVERIGGVVEIASRAGAGSQFLIRIPLTLAIVSSLIVETGGQRFALPLSAVEEIVRTGAHSSHRIERLGNAAMLRLRGGLVPVIDLRAALGVEGPGVATDNIVILAIGGQRIGCAVGAVHDIEEIVVKPLSRLLGNPPAMAGVTILGDGSVVTILDPAGLASHVEADAPPADAGAADVAVSPAEKVLLFRAGAKVAAVPLPSVARLEEVERNQIVDSAGRPVLNYAGQILPLVDHSSADGERRRIVVLQGGTNRFGLVVDEIVDLAEATPLPPHGARSDGLLDSQIIHDRVTDILDPQRLAELALAA